MEPTLLLTATITPPADALNLNRADPVARLDDYLRALTFYLELPDAVLRRIVFVENSDSDLTPLRDLAARHPGKEVELIGFAGLDHPGKYGRGYGEFKLLNYAFDHSEQLRRLGPEDKVWKGTGRLKLLNFAAMVRNAPPAYDLYCDLRNIPTRWMDMRYFSFTPGGYRGIFSNELENMREDIIHPFAIDQEHCVSPEQLMRERIEQKFGQFRIVPRFRTQPMIEGISGFHNTNYGTGLQKKLRGGIKSLSRKVLPKLWI